MTEPGWPFLGVEVLAAKRIPERAMRTLYEPIYPGVYAPWGVELDASQRARAAWLWSRRNGVVAGNSAAALLGSKWVSRGLAAELVHVNRKPPPKLVAHTDTLKPGEVISVDGMAVTNPARTAFDIGRRAPSRLLALQRLDALANATGVDRHTALAELGWVIIRVSAEMLRYREATLIGRVVDAMRAAGWAGPGPSVNRGTLPPRVAS